MNNDNLVHEILGTEFTERIGKHWTFAGVLIEYWEDVSKHWRAESTRSSYLKDYKKYVLPHLNELPLKDCDRLNFDQCLELLPKAKREEGLTYNLGVERHIKWIIKKVLEVAEKKGVCPDVLWGTDYSFSEGDTEEKLNVDELVTLRKSFDISEEVNISRIILEDPEQSGEKFGLAQMFALGLRNNEACGTKFGDIQPFRCDNNRYYMRIYSSTEYDSNEERFGGKTGNMHRFIPIPTVLLKLLFQRRKFLRELILSKKITIKEKEEGGVLDEKTVEQFIDTLPIACIGTSYTTACHARALTQSAKQLLKDINVNQKILSLIDREFRHKGYAEDGIKEKEPTAYLFRRNLGTHLYLLGLTDSEIQYIMGHDIEDDNEERNFFRNEEKLYPIALKMEKRPIVNETNTKKIKEMTSNWLHERDVCQEEVHIPVSAGDKKVVVTIEQREPLSKLEIKVKGPVEGSYEQFPYEAPIEETMTITPLYHAQYGRRIRKMESLRQGEASEEV